ncbi:MAG TPA: hypothetical protein VH475_06120 [Tepidisphaeraceae bacterium]|jgi:hypothetical protein
MAQQQTDLESEQFMTLLTDALRAGPGSPEWHQAIGILRASGAAANADEYQLLVRAREDLESGRDYRAVKPGAGFSRKVLQGIEEEAGPRPRGLPSANLIAWLAGGVILAVAVVVAVILLRKTPEPANNGAIEQLKNTYFINPVAQLNFDNAPTDIGPEWKLVGDVPLKVRPRDGLYPATTQPTTARTENPLYKSGVIVLAESIPPDQPRLLDVTFKAPRPTDAIIPEVFIAQGPPEEGPNGSGRELVWQLKAGAARVALADGRVPVQAEKIDSRKNPMVNVKLRFNRDTVVVETEDRRIYEGPHKLSEASPRYVGVRFRRKIADNSDGVWLNAISVMKP